MSVRASLRGRVSVISADRFYILSAVRHRRLLIIIINKLCVCQHLREHEHAVSFNTSSYARARNHSGYRVHKEGSID